MLSLRKYKPLPADIPITFKTHTHYLEMYVGNLMVDSCDLHNNEAMYEVSVGYSDYPVEVSSNHSTMMFIETNELRTYTVKEILSVMVKNNKIKITPCANMEDFDY